TDRGPPGLFALTRAAGAPEVHVGVPAYRLASCADLLWPWRGSRVRWRPAPSRRRPARHRRAPAPWRFRPRAARSTPRTPANRCDRTGPDLGGAGVRALSQYHGRPVYVVGSRVDATRARPGAAAAARSTTTATRCR